MSSADVPALNRIRLRVLGVTLSGLFITIGASWWLGGVERQASNAQFLQEANERFHAFGEGIEDAKHALDTVNGLFDTVGDVSREQFGTFVEPLLSKYPYILSISYQRIIPKAGRGAYEAGMHGTVPGFQLRKARNDRLAPSSVKPVYRVVDYLFPLTGDEDALGVDASSIAEQEAAIMRAAKSDKTVASGLFHVIAERSTGTGFMLVKRVCAPSRPFRSDPAACDVRGYTAAIFSTKDFIHTILEQGGFLERQDYKVALYAVAGPMPGSPLYAFPQQTAVGRRGATSQGGRSLTRSFDVAGTTLNMVVTSRAAPAGAGTLSASQLLMMFGIALTTLLGLHIRSTSLRAFALKKANQALQQDIALREEAQAALLRSEAELRELARHQEQVREDERKHIAREIHDDLGQNLLVLRIDVTLAAQRLETTCPESREWMESILRQIDGTVKSVRQIINRLRPAALDLGPLEAIKWLVDQMNKPGKVRFVLDCPDEEALAGLREDQAVSLFRIVQEAAANVLRHANASNAKIEVRRTDTHICVAVIDDGSGSFPSDRRKSRSFGLIGIKERVAAEGGEFLLTAEPGKGTAVRFKIRLDTVGNAGMDDWSV